MRTEVTVDILDLLLPGRATATASAPRQHHLWVLHKCSLSRRKLHRFLASESFPKLVFNFVQYFFFPASMEMITRVNSVNVNFSD